MFRRPSALVVAFVLLAGCAGGSGAKGGSGADGRLLVDTVSAAWWLTTLPFKSTSGAASDYMHEAKPGTELPAPTDAAVVVFVRPSKGLLGSKMTFLVMDGEGRFVGESLPETHFAVVRAPGPASFHLSGKGTAVRGVLEAGKRYWVYLDVSLGLLGPGVELEALAPGKPSWAELPTWLRTSTYLIADTKAADAGLRHSERERTKAIASAVETLDGYKGEKVQLHTLAPAN